MEATLYKKIDDFQNKTFEAVTEQEVIQSEEEEMNAVLDKINSIRNGLTNLIPFFESLLDDIVKDIPSCDKRDLIFLRNKVESLHNSTKKLNRSLATGKYSNAFTSLITEYKVLNSDLYEIISDIEKKVKGNKEINDLLGELTDF
jgi:hypothetical protein